MVLVSQISTSVKTQCLSTRMRGPQSAITGGQALGSQEPGVCVLASASIPLCT